MYDTVQMTDIIPDRFFESNILKMDISVKTQHQFFEMSKEFCTRSLYKKVRVVKNKFNHHRLLLIYSRSNFPL